MNSILEYADLLDYLQDEDELADEYDVAINHTILLNTANKPTCETLDEAKEIKNEKS